MNNEEPKKSLKPLFIAFAVLAVASLLVLALPKSVSEQNPSAEPKPPAEEQAVQVSVFFANSILDPDITCTKVFPVSRLVPKGENEMTFAIEQLLAGPTPEERARNYETGLNSGVRLLSLKTSNGVAYADFDRQLNFEVGGSCRIGFIRTQIERTLQQFPGVREVVISVEGETEAILEP